MSLPEPQTASTTATSQRRWVGLALVGLLILFLVLRIPLAISNSGEVDEDWFTVPGWTVLHEGIPRIPYAPDRDPTGVFYRGDEILFGMPPGFFYWEAVFFYLFPDGYAAGRSASMLAGAITIVLVYLLSLSLTNERWVSWTAAAMYSFSRVFYFPATIVRPDMLCAMFGALAVLCIIKWSSSTNRKHWLIASGVACGLGLLTHPFAIVFCLQCGIWVLLQRSLPIKLRFWSACLLTAVAIIAVLPWSVLISRDVDLFRLQFSNNVLSRTQSGLFQRFILFWEPLRYHLFFLGQRTQILQLTLMIGGLLLATAMTIVKNMDRSQVLYWAWTSVYLLIALQGKHPSMGYWSYPAIFVFIATSQAIAILMAAIPCTRLGFTGKSLIAFTLIVVMVAGSGVRAWWQVITNWTDPRFNSRYLVAQLLEDLPPDAAYLVDRSFVFDFFLAGRNTTLGLNDPRFFQAAGLPYEYLVINPKQSRVELPAQLHAEFVREYGSLEHQVAHVYRHAESQTP